MSVSKAKFRLIPVEMSDLSHVPLQCLIEFPPSQTVEAVDIESSVQKQVYCFKKANYDTIRNHLESIRVYSTF